MTPEAGPRAGDEAHVPARDLRDAERAAAAAVDERDLVAFLRELVAVPSLDGEETAAQRTVAEWMTAEGLATDVWEIDLASLTEHPEFSCEVERDGALGVVGWVGKNASDEGGRDLLFDGHIDVVPAGEAAAWTVDPWRGALRDGRVYGRGACDMKGGLCAALFAAKALHDAQVPLRGRVLVASVAGEEDGGLGTLATLLRGHGADGAIVTEPTSLQIVTAGAGSLMFRITVWGRSAHASVREAGVSAVEKFIPVFTAIREVEARRNAAGGGELFAAHRLPWPIEVGTLRAGEWASSVPERLVCEGRFGLAPGEDEASARREFEDALAAVAAGDAWLRAHPPLVEWWGGRFAPAVTDPDDPLVRTLAAATEAVLGRRAPLAGVTYGSDMRLLVNVGRMPTVLFGPGDVRECHMPDESVPVAEVAGAARTLAVTAVRYCGVR
ncbi:MAG TPA: ArgE/DapE family deacylase [Thermoleophilia bacterium]|nr:ArgE/DapE family deacylase [Thermoleophilia bacterium]